MLHKRRSFTVPVSQGTATMCAEKGHSATDRFGKCLCCGAKVAPHGLSAPNTPRWPSEAASEHHPTAAQTVESFKHLRNTRTE
jgi:hypothetical protein